MAKNYTNPDLDSDFFKLYAATADKMNQLVGNAQGETYILCGEGILGLEAACASFIEKGDRVLTIANGIFGKGFGDFSAMYGAEVFYYESEPTKGIDPEALSEYIEANGPFKLATLVHCETPSGLTNPVHLIGPILRKLGILSIVDSVSAIGGEAMEMNDWQLDVVLCGSQKVISAPPGLTTVSLSPIALEMLDTRKTPVAGFYANLQIWKDYDKKQWFPYTQPIHMIAGLKLALDRIERQASVKRHERLADAVRKTVVKSGFKLFAQSDYANTVTTVYLPEGLDFKDLLHCLKTDHKVLIGGGFDFLENKIFRIGHMGENCTEDRLSALFLAMDSAFSSLGVTLETPFHKNFETSLNRVSVL
jgi:aspartate aminotransferase-like enzyme